MRGYEDYEDLDEYEDDEQEEEAVEYEEDPQPTKEELDYLQLRQRLKESIRRQMKKGNASSNSREKNKASYNNYGSFFGPSQPVIAQRVIQESKLLLENRHLTGNASKPQIQKGTTVSSSNAIPRPQGSTRPQNVVNQQKLKVETLKHARDYSFLLSDDAELPVPSREPPSRNPSVPNSGARPANVLPNSRQQSHNGVSRQVPHGDNKNRTHSSMSSCVDPKIGYQKSVTAVKNNQMATGVRKQPISSSGSTNGSGQGRPVAQKGSSLSSKPPPTSVERKMSSAKYRSSYPPMAHKPPPTKLHSSASKQIPAPKQVINGGHRREQMELGREKVPVRPSQPSARPQLRPPPAKLPPRTSLHDDRIKKKPLVKQAPAKRPFEEDDDYEAQNISGMIRGLFNYNPNKYTNYEDDDSDMEANYDDIMREERKSAMIATREDEEELLKIEEEERRERMRRLKKRKVG